jgi:hypothetical protein
MKQVSRQERAEALHEVVGEFRNVVSYIEEEIKLEDAVLCERMRTTYHALSKLAQKVPSLRYAEWVWICECGDCQASRRAEKEEEQRKQEQRQLEWERQQKAWQEAREQRQFADLRSVIPAVISDDELRTVIKERGFAAERELLALVVEKMTTTQAEPTPVEPTSDPDDDPDANDGPGSETAVEATA